jgi:hypothetical protein
MRGHHQHTQKLQTVVQNMKVASVSKEIYPEAKFIKRKIRSMSQFLKQIGPTIRDVVTYANSQSFRPPHM